MWRPASTDEFDLDVASARGTLLSFEGLARQWSGERGLLLGQGVREPGVGGRLLLLRYCRYVIAHHGVPVGSNGPGRVFHLQGEVAGEGRGDAAHLPVGQWLRGGLVLGGWV